MPARTPELIGRTFGDLFVKEIVPEPPHLKPQKGHTYYLCECHCHSPNCFKTLIVRKSHLVSGNTKSCKANKRFLDTIEKVQEASFKHIYSKGRYNDDNITLEQFISLASSNCFYCGALPQKSYNDFGRNNGTKFSIEHGTIKYNGLDRISSVLPHSLSNVVPCCYTCNRFKLDSTYPNFLNHIPHLNENFTIKLLDQFTAVRNKIKLFQEGKIQVPNSKGKTPLSKLYPEKYGKAERSYLYCMADTFRRNTQTEKKVCEFTIEEVAELMMANCTYCNQPPNLIDGEFNGIDRFENTQTGYTRDNSVPACFWCNSAKGQLSVEEFRAWIVRLKTNFNNLPKSKNDLIQCIESRNSNL